MLWTEPDHCVVDAVRVYSTGYVEVPWEAEWTVHSMKPWTSHKRSIKVGFYWPSQADRWIQLYAVGKMDECKGMQTALPQWTYKPGQTRPTGLTVTVAFRWILGISCAVIGCAIIGQCIVLCCMHRSVATSRDMTPSSNSHDLNLNSEVAESYATLSSRDEETADGPDGPDGPDG